MGNLLNMSGGSLLKKGLPYDAEIEYLRGDGQAYIKTGILFTDNITVKSKMMFISQGATEKSPAFALFGYRFTVIADIVGNMRWFLIYNTDRDGRLGVRFGVDYANSSNRITPSLTKVYDVDFDGSHLIVNGSNWVTVSNKYQTSNYGEMYIFWANSEGYYSDDFNKSTHSITRFQIYDSGTLVRDFVPVRKGQVGYLYDKISGRLFGNAGTGNFILGNDI